MTISTSSRPTDVDQALVHQFIRVFGRRPTPGELSRYQQAQVGLAWGLAARTRRGVARVIARA